MAIGLTLALIAALGAGWEAPARAHASGCDLVAAPNGSDGASGTTAAPLATVQTLVDRLGAGQTGCLRAGTYSGEVRFNHGGSGGAPITLTAYPGENARVVGRIYIPSGSNFIDITELTLDGRNSSQLPSPTIDASDVAFIHDEVTNEHTGICFDLGNLQLGRAVRIDIERNRIHGCGELPATNHDHGIYDESSAEVVIAWNEIYDNADRGINLYPDATDTTISHNVIDSNGEGVVFSGDYGYASSQDTVTNNLITNATVRHDVESWYPGGNPVGQDNVVSSNCVWGGTGLSGESIDSSAGGFDASNNLVADPGYVDSASGNYHLQPNSPCAGISGDIAAAVDGGANPSGGSTQSSSASYAGPAVQPPALTPASYRAARSASHARHHATRHRRTIRAHRHAAHRSQRTRARRSGSR